MVSNNHCIYLCQHCQYCKYCQRLMSSQEISGDTMRSLEIPWDPMSSLDIRGEREFPFQSIPKNESLWFSFRNYGNGFFHSLPVPEIRECFFFIPFPFPNYGNGFFSFPSRSRIVGMDFFHSLPVPEFREWIFSIPFPFLNWPFQSRESKGKMGDFKRC